MTAFNLNNIPVYQSDLLIIGGGVAGLTAAVSADDDLRINLLTKGRIKETNTWFAQGGIAAAVGRGDSPAEHFRDTVNVGGGLCDERAVSALVEGAPAAINFLIALGMEFDRDAAGDLLPAREGGHSRARVLHAGDGTGSVVAATLGRAAGKLRNLSLNQSRFALDLLRDDGRCRGVLAYSQADKRLEAYLAANTILASGGLGQIYQATTNPILATGDGFAMAARAGAALVGMEFVQFHPTAFYSRDNPRFLISEALRGDGAYLRDINGERFMPAVHEAAELAPRDIVSRKIIEVMRDTGAEYVLLDATHLPRTQIKSHFPGIYDFLSRRGYDLAVDMVPVSPVAHYMMGGVKTDINALSSIPGLFVSGEAACTGVHGANRLASNSLLEGLVFSRRAVEYILNQPVGSTTTKLETIYKPVKRATLSLDWPSLKKELQQLMWKNVGIIRNRAGLEAAEERLTGWLTMLKGAATEGIEAWEFTNMVQTAFLITKAALARRESIGAHYRVD